MNKAILFDIDGTLLYAKGLGRPAFAKAFTEAYGIKASFDDISFVGATDTAVIRAMAKSHGKVSTTANEEHFYIALSRELDAALAAHPPKVYDGVRPLLARLVNAGYILGTVTGNIRETAWSKLIHADLARYFSFGAYSTDHYDRDTLAAIAVARARELDARVVLLSGDTPKDIQAAHAIHVPCLSVLTGWVDGPTLQAAGADSIVQDFTDLEATFQLITELCHD